MAAGPSTRVSDIIVPSIFTSYQQNLTETKSRLIASGAVVRDPAIDALLAGGGLTFNVPSFKDLDNDSARVSTDTIYAGYTGGTADPDPFKIGTLQEVAVRMNRNASWNTSQLAGALAGADPAAAIAALTAGYWTRQLQLAFVATVNGIFADNDAAPSGSEHTRYDLTSDISGSAYVAGVTDFSAEAFLDAALLMGDSQDSLTMVMVHSVVYNRMQKNNLIDFITDSDGKVSIPTFLGRQVIVDDGVTKSSTVYDTWLFGPGAFRLGMGSPDVPVEVHRLPGAGNGAGAETIYNRVEWSIHPAGHKYAGTAPNGGPSNAASSNNLADAGSWQRVFPERKQIKIARLKTREA